MAKGRPRNTAAPAGATPANPQPALERDLFLAADKLRKNLEPSDDKHVVLGLIFLRHISLAFEARHAALLLEDQAAAEDRTNPWARPSSGCRRKPAGRTFRPTRRSPASAS
jgi:type I restriction enzyme M protein